MVESGIFQFSSKRMLRLCLSVAMLISMATWFGCGEEPKPAEQKPAEEAAAGDEAGGEEGDGTETASAEGEKTKKPVKPDTPAEIMKKLPYRDITIKASDKLMLSGRLYDPSLKPVDPAAEEEEEAAPDEEEAAAPTGPIKKYPVIILLHSLNGNYDDWSDLPAKFVKQGYAVFAMDMRGHGNSVKLGKRLVGWRNFQPEDWLVMSRDVEDVQKFFEKSPQYAEVDTTRVALIGGGLGANVALKAASDYGQAVKALVLLSPSLEIKGLNAAQSVLYYSNPVFISASQEDPYFAQSAESIFKWAQGPKSIRIYKNIGQGTEMLTYEPSFSKEILAWMEKRFPPGIRIVTPPPPPAEEGDAAAEEKPAAKHH